MTKETLTSLLKWLKINPRHYSLDGGLPSNKYVFSEEGGKWNTYYSEKGQRI